MRVVLIGVSHWHTPFFLDPCLSLPDVTIVGVSDPILARAEPAAAKAGCKPFTDYREMCAALRPDFAFALARHCEMADLARFLIDQRIAFAMEKPCAINAAEASDIANRAAVAGVFAAVPYVIRYSPMIEIIRSNNESVQYCMFKFIGGMVDRYRQQQVDWVIDRKASGGGALLNLGVATFTRRPIRCSTCTIRSELRIITSPPGMTRPWKSSPMTASAGPARSS
ncbi:Gfo/Idh/MocA family oxidoreductase [Rhodopila sp.]|uniref:Gfo/Idh/MocA family oxidoreductase n=1 Tax=Rhodopila sp. TaxID=2480087 RepID=UPI003D111FBE